MLRIFNIICVGLIFSSIAFAQDGYRVKNIKPQFSFVPTGFDSNDRSKIVMYGIFTDVCHKVVEPRVKVDRANYKIYVQHRVSVREMCIDMYVNIPYTTVVDLGTLPVGKYEVLAGDDKGYQRVDMLTIRSTPAPTSVDDFFYAQVDQIKYRGGEGLSFGEVTLQGAITNTCLSLKEIKVTYSPGRVVDIQPILNVRNHGCRPSKTKFSKTVQIKIPGNKPSLLNVRSAGGQEILQVIDPRETIFSSIEKIKP